MKKLFGETKISWKFLIIFSVVIGVVVGGLNRIPFLRNTSFQDIAIVLDMWIILAIFVIVNCKSLKEAVAKCFVFFLISQPLIYFTEVIIDVFVSNSDFKTSLILYFRNYYYGAGWLFATILVIPRFSNSISNKEKQYFICNNIISCNNIFSRYGNSRINKSLDCKFPISFIK